MNQERNFFTLIKPEKFFLVAAPLLYVLYSFFCPPFQIPDDYNHFYRAYQVSQGHFFAEKKDNRVGGEVPLSFEEFALHFKTLSNIPEQRLQPDEILNSFSIPVSEKTVFKDFPNTALYSPVAYLPHAIAMAILRKSDCSVGTLYYGGRIAAFLIWYFLMYMVISMLPLQKWLFTMLLLLPMQLYLVSSYSADAMTSSLAFVLIAFVFRVAFTSTPVTRKQLSMILLLAMLLVLTKVLYGLLLALVVIIPSANFGSLKRKVIACVILVFLLLIFSAGWGSIIFRYHTTFAGYNPAFASIATLSQQANYPEQKEILRQEPLKAFEVVYETMLHDYDFFLTSYAGHFGTYMDTRMPAWAVPLVFILLFLTAITDGSSVTIRFWQRFTLLLTGIMIFAAIILSQYLVWSRVGATYVEFLQGRYLIPVFPLFLCFFSGTVVKRSFLPVFYIVTILLLNSVALHTLYGRYVNENYSSRILFKSSFEKQTANGFYRTSEPGFYIQSSGGPMTQAARSGSVALVLPFGGAVNCIYELSGFSQGDLFQIDVWKKGEGGQIAVTGCGENCPDFYYLNDMVVFEDQQGWQRLNMTFCMFNCEKGRGAIYFRNNKETPVIFDDVRILIKHGKMY